MTRVVIATTRLEPEIGHVDPRYVMQGHIAIVSSPIDADGEGEIQFAHAQSSNQLRARNLGVGGIAAGEEVCIERIEDGIAFVEHWSQVEKRL